MSICGAFEYGGDEGPEEGLASPNHLSVLWEVQK